MSTIGERLKAARHRAGLSQRSLAQKVGLSAMAISKYERGEMVPNSSMLIRLAQALDTQVAYLLRPPSLSLSAPAFRKHHALSARARQALLAQAQDWLERYLDVEALFPEEQALFAMPEGWPQSASTMEAVEEAATALRQVWGLGLDPIDNLAETLEDLGIKVGILPAVDHFDALTLWANERVPAMVVRESIPGDRERFNLAHELGHLMLRPIDDLDEEKAANRFAGAFLVPARAAYRELGRNRRHLSTEELHLLKHKYGLSMQAWIYRARDLGIISPSYAVQAFKAFRQNGWHRQEPGRPYPYEYPQRMRRLVLRALADGLISRSRAAELLATPWDAFAQKNEVLLHDVTIAAARFGA